MLRLSSGLDGVDKFFSLDPLSSRGSAWRITLPIPPLPGLLVLVNAIPSGAKLKFSLVGDVRGVVLSLSRSRFAGEINGEPGNERERGLGPTYDAARLVVGELPDVNEGRAEDGASAG